MGSRLRFRQVLLLAMATGYYALHAVPVVETRSEHCDQLCHSNTYCGTGCYDWTVPTYTDCGTYTNGNCDPNLPCTWNNWAPYSVLGSHDRDFYHPSAGHWDCVMTNNVAYRRADNCNNVEFTCGFSDQSWTLIHNAPYSGYCADQYGEWGTESCPY